MAKRVTLRLDVTTDPRATVVRELFDSMTITALARHMGASPSTVAKIALAIGLPPKGWMKPQPKPEKVKRPHPHYYTPEQRAFVRDNWQVMTDEAIADAIGKTAGGVSRHRRANGMVKPQNGIRAVAHQKPAHRAWGARKPAPTERVVSTLDLAAAHVATVDRTPCFRIPGSDEWRYGTTRWTGEHLMSRAQAKGFRAGNAA